VLRLFPALGLLLISFSLSFAAQGQSQTPLRVLTSVKPLQLIAAAVQDGVGQPDVLLPPGASPHHYALRPSDVRNVREVELLYWIGPDLESFLPRVLAGRTKPSVSVQDLPQMSLRHFGDSDTLDNQINVGGDDGNRHCQAGPHRRSSASRGL
jgi:zinc transport system substrate-binding protein